MRRGIGRLLGATALSLVAIVGPSVTANADVGTWVYHSHYGSVEACEQAWQDMNAGSPVAGPHECRENAVGQVWELWYLEF